MKKNTNNLAKKIIKPFKSISLNKIALPIKKTYHWLGSFKHILAYSLLLIVFLYYPLGGMLIHNIDRSIDFEAKISKPGQSSTIEAISFLINREINNKLWTPNLPFFFPSYFLDNMPNFQLGLMEGMASFSNNFANKIPTSQNNLKKGAEFLKYPGKTWMFSSNNKLVPAPSANSKYRRARKQLQKYNDSLANNSEVFYKKPEDLSFFLIKTGADLSSSLQSIENHIREVSPVLIDTRADNVFYYNQGKVYAYYIILKSLGQDYKDVLVEHNLYHDWTKMLKALEMGGTLDPVIVRNGELNSSFSPNHLSYLGYNILKAQNHMQRMVIKLETQRKK